MSWVRELARPEIVALKPYEHASWEPSLERMHANDPTDGQHRLDCATGLTKTRRLVRLSLPPAPQPFEGKTGQRKRSERQG